MTLEPTDLARSLVDKNVDTFSFPDGRFEVRWKDRPLPYGIFDHDQQQVTPAQVTQNKRLADAPAWVKEQKEDGAAPEAEIKSISDTRACKTYRLPITRISSHCVESSRSAAGTILSRSYARNEGVSRQRP